MPWYGWLPVIAAAWLAAGALISLWFGPRLKRIRETETREP